MNLQDLNPYLIFAFTAVNFLTTIYNLMSSSSKKNSTAISSLNEAVTNHGSRIQSLESDIKHLPDARAFGEMRLSISELGGKLGRMEESQSNSARDIARMMDFLVKGAA